ncbi:MAG TPA: hypothetical protein VKE72_07060 [Methylocella sp.]|nr:hypothetical protein [Methylocella sp.]
MTAARHQFALDGTMRVVVGDDGGFKGGVVLGVPRGAFDATRCATG